MFNIVSYFLAKFLNALLAFFAPILRHKHFKHLLKSFISLGVFELMECCLVNNVSRDNSETLVNLLHPWIVALRQSSLVVCFCVLGKLIFIFIHQISQLLDLLVLRKSDLDLFIEKRKLVGRLHMLLGNK